MSCPREIPYENSIQYYEDTMSYALEEAINNPDNYEPNEDPEEDKPE
jgi:hypothetical protein